MHHNGHKHPAKSRGLRVRSNKVEFSLVNRVSLIFKLKHCPRTISDFSAGSELEKDKI